MQIILKNLQKFLCFTLYTNHKGYFFQLLYRSGLKFLFLNFYYIQLVDEISQVRDSVGIFGHAFCHRATASRPVLKAELDFDWNLDIER